MKSEHRHELQTNDLSKLFVQAGEFLQKNRQPLLIATITIVVLVAAYAVYSSRVGTDSAESWTRLASAQSAEAFANVADDFEGTTAGAWARLRESELNLQQGIPLAFTNRPGEINEISELKQAKRGFDKLLNDSSVPAAVRERALMGMARYLETTCDGNTEAAIRAYKQYVSEFQNSSQRPLAEKRIEALETQSAKDFYAWFYKQHPKPADRAKPQDGFHGTQESEQKDPPLFKLPSDIKDFLDPDFPSRDTLPGGTLDPGDNDSKTKAESSDGAKTDKRKPETDSSKGDSKKSTEKNDPEAKQKPSKASKDEPKAVESKKPATPK